jgi:hypothetical protein
MQKIVAYIGWTAFFTYLVLVQGCAPEGRTSTWRVDSPELAAAAKTAADAWCEASEGEWCPVIDDPQGAPIRASQDERPDVCGTYGTVSRTITVYLRTVGVGGCWVVGSDGEFGDTSAEIVAILAHEMAHDRLSARGLYGEESHSPDPLSVIHQPTNYWAGGIRAEDVAFVLGVNPAGTTAELAAEAPAGTAEAPATATPESAATSD